MSDIQTATAAIIQLSSQDDVAQNLAAIKQQLQQAKAAGAQMALLPENCAFMGVTQVAQKTIAEPLADLSAPIQGALSQFARTLSLFIVAGSVPTRVADKVYQTSLAFDATGACVAYYHKRHLFDVCLPTAEESYRESDAFTSGDDCVVVDSPIGRLGLSICYDLRFPEHFRKLVEMGADVLLLPAAFTYQTGQAHWEILLRARAIENQCVLLASAQCGQHPSGRQTWGHSMAIDAWGNVLAHLEETPDVLLCQFDLSAQQRIRTRFPALLHRREG